MATIRTKEIEIFRTNPNGSEENLNSSTRYSIYLNSRKQYVINVTPCNKTPYGFQHDMLFADTTAPLIMVTRKSAKTQRICEDFLTNNIEAIDTAYIHNGMAGVKEVVRDLWH